MRQAAVFANHPVSDSRARQGRGLAQHIIENGRISVAIEMINNISFLIDRVDRIFSRTGPTDNFGRFW